MSDDTTNSGSTASPAPPPPAPGAADGWTPAAPGSTPPPPPPADPTGQLPVPTSSVGSSGGGGGVSLSLDDPIALVLGLVAVVGVVLGLLLKGDAGGTTDPRSFWTQMGWTWAVLAIVAAVATLLPLARTAVGMSAKQVSTIVSIGAGILVLEWVLFVLPQISSNRAFLLTLAVLAAAGAAWRARPVEAD